MYTRTSAFLSFALQNPPKDRAVLSIGPSKISLAFSEVPVRSRYSAMLIRGKERRKTWKEGERERNKSAYKEKIIIECKNCDGMRMHGMYRLSNSEKK